MRRWFRVVIAFALAEHEYLLVCTSACKNGDTYSQLDFERVAGRREKCRQVLDPAPSIRPRWRQNKPSAETATLIRTSLCAEVERCRLEYLFI